MVLRPCPIYYCGAWNALAKYYAEADCHCTIGPPGSEMELIHTIPSFSFVMRLKQRAFGSFTYAHSFLCVILTCSFLLKRCVPDRRSAIPEQESSSTK